jgi:hypothetical protein
MRLNNRTIYTFFILVTVLLLSVWTRNTLFIATGESGLQFYNAQGNINYFKHSWSQGAIGLPTSYAVSSYPFLYLISTFEQLGLAPTIMQSIFFFAILICCFISFFLLISEHIPKKQRSNTEKILLYLVPSLFYVFNLFAMVNIWNRFQYTFMMFYAFLPLGTFIFYKGLRKNAIHYTLILNIAMIPFSIAFSSIPLLLLYWAVLALYALYYLINNRRSKKHVQFVIAYFLLSIITWFITNAWWVVQFIYVLKNSTYVASEAYTPSGNIETFILLSEKLGNLSYLFRLMHKDFFINMQKVWGDSYFNPLVIIATYVIPLLAFFPLLLKKKPAYVIFFLGLALGVLFLTKGASGPFGFIFLNAFAQIRILEAFRNPFEKIGMLLPLTYAPLIGYSLYTISQWFRHKYGRVRMTIFVTSSMTLLFIILVFPYWNRWIYTSTQPPANNTQIGSYVQIPQYYKEANAFLNRDKDEFRVMALPMSGEGITYKWPWGYSGVELSNGIFDKPFISFTTAIQFYKAITLQSEKVFFEHPENFYQMMQILNVKYVMNRSDVDYKLRQTTNPSLIQQRLAHGIPNIEKTNTFNHLEFYKLNEAEFVPHIYSAQNIISSSANAELFYEILPYSDYQKRTVYITQSAREPARSAQQTIIKADLLQDILINVNKENALKELPSIRITPDKSTYFIIQLKEQLEKFLAKGEIKEFFNLNLSSKRLVETERLISQNSDPKIVNNTIDNYLETINQVDQYLLIGNSRAKEILVRQYNVLQDLTTKNASGKYNIQMALEKVNKLIIETKTPSIDNTATHQYRFEIIEDGEYEVTLNTKGLTKYFFVPDKLKYTLDGVEGELSFADTDIELSLGFHQLTKGQHELAITRLEPKNLINTIADDVQVMSSSNTETNFDYEVNEFDGSASYTVSTDYHLKKGDMPIISFILDTDTIEDSKIKPTFYQSLPEIQKFYDWQSYKKVITANPSARSAKIRIAVASWNNCETLYKLRCLSKNFKKMFSQNSEIEIKNLKLQKNFDSLVLIKKRNTDFRANSAPEINFTKINSSEYKVTIKNASEPFMIVLSESFHPLWKAKIDGKHIEETKHLLVNSYANGWMVDKSGNYSMNLEFIAEGQMNLGKTISLIGIGVIILFLLVIVVRKEKTRND